MAEAPKFCITTPQLVTLHSSHCGEAGEEEGGRRGLANYARFGRVSRTGAEVGERGRTGKGEGDVAAATAPKGSLIYLHEAALPCCHSVTQLRFGRSPHCRDAFARFRGPRSRSSPSTPPFPPLSFTFSPPTDCLISLGVDYGDGCAAAAGGGRDEDVASVDEVTRLPAIAM